jgi:hypothetical protein
MRVSTAHKYAAGAILALDAVIDRLQHGDWKVCRVEKHNENNKLVTVDELTRVPVPAKDCGYLASMCTDKHALLTGTSAAHGKANSALAQVMSKLDEALALARKLPNKQATDTTDPVDNAK